MTTFKKTIVLNNPTASNYNGSAILTLTLDNNCVYGTIKTFNINNHSNLVLGLAQNNKQVFKQNINLINNNTYNFRINNIDLNQNITCVLVEDQPTKVIPLIWGSDDRSILKDEIIDNLNILKYDNKSTVNQNYVQDNISTLEEPSSYEDNTNDTQELNEVEEVDDTQELFESSDEEIEEEINNNLEFDDESIQTDYQEDNMPQLNPYGQKNDGISKVLANKNIIEQELENTPLPDNVTFYEALSEQIEDLFNKYPAETNLENLVPNSKWVKIDYENDGNYYVLGLIYEDITLKYICYGVPGTYSEIAPNGLDNYSQWLPTDIDNPTEEGYWVMYQDALTGESIEVDAI